MSASDSATSNQQFACELMHALAELGLTDVVISPGSRSTPLVLAAEVTAGLTTHVVLDERAAGFFALGIARGQGRPAILVATSGSAATHYFPAVAEALANRIPLVLLTADRPHELQDCGAPQTMVQRDLFGRHTVASFQVGTVDEHAANGLAQSWAARVVYAAEGAAGGPVQLNIPFREPLWPAQGISGAAGEPSAVAVRPPALIRGRSILDPAQLDALADLLRRKQRGVIVAAPMEPGAQGGIAGKRTWAKLGNALHRLADCLAWPLLVEALSPARSVAPSSGRAQAVLCGDFLLQTPQLQRALEPEIVFRLGGQPTSKALFGWLSSAAEHVVVDPSPSWQDPAHRLSHRIVADPLFLLEELCARLSGRPRPQLDWCRRWQIAESSARSGVETMMEEAASAEPWEGAVALLVAQFAADHKRPLHVASSMPVRDVNSYHGAVGPPLSICANRGLNGIDGTVATAAGEAHACDGAIALCGDLAFLHDLDGLHASNQLGVPLTIVVVDNQGGGIFERLPIRIQPDVQQQERFERLFLTPQRVDLERVIRAFGIAWRQATTLNELRQGLAWGLQQDGLSVIGVPIKRDYSLAKNHRVVEAVTARAQRDLVAAGYTI